MARALSKPQQELLAEIRQSATGGLWIDQTRRYGRTASALLNKGLVKVAAQHWPMAFYVPLGEEPA